MEPGASKMEPGASKMEPGASKMASNLVKIDQKDGLEALKLPKRAKQTPGKPPGRAPGSQNGSQGVPGHPKTSKMVPNLSQNGVQNRSKMGSDSECSKMSIFDRFLSQFSIKKTCLTLIDSAKIWCLD